jgi:hypothetical protein
MFCMHTVLIEWTYKRLTYRLNEFYVFLRNNTSPECHLITEE